MHITCFGPLYGCLTVVPLNENNIGHKEIFEGSPISKERIISKTIIKKILNPIIPSVNSIYLSLFIIC